MAQWEIIREILTTAHAAGRDWLTGGEIIKEMQRKDPTGSYQSFRANLSAYCINDPSKKHYPGLLYRKNPLLITDDPTKHGKRFRLLTDAERTAFLSSPRDDLNEVSYAQAKEWLDNPTAPLEVGQLEDATEPIDDASFGELTGPALLELHLQDYLFRHWTAIFPDLNLYKGSDGREFRTTDPSVGVLDFLCTDPDGNFVVIETKRNVPDRQAIGQILGYVGWVSEKLCAQGQSVRAILIASEITDQLRFAIKAAPNLALHVYEISFNIKPA